MLKKYLPYLTSALCFLYSAALLITPGSHPHAAIIMGVIALAFVLITVRNVAHSSKVAALAILGYWILTIISLLVKGGDLSQLDMPSRTLFILPIIGLLITYRPSTKWVMIGTSVGSILAFAVGIYQLTALGLRPLGSQGYMAIQAGGMVMTLGTLSLISAFYFKTTNKKGLFLLALLGALAGFGISLLNGSRGILVISPFVIVAIFWLHKHLISKKMMTSGALAFAVITVAAYPILSQRLNTMFNELANYHSYSASDHSAPSGNFSASARIELWKSALYMAKDTPVFGAGFKDINRIRAEQIAQGLIDPRTAKYTRAHSQFFEDLQTKGLIGVTVLLLMFGVPLNVFIKRYKAYKDTEEGYFALMGACHIVLLMGYCLTQHYLAHHSGMLLFVTYTAIFLAMSEPPKISTDRN